MEPSLSDFLLRRLGDYHLWEHALVRRQFLSGALGATATGAVLGSGILSATPAFADSGSGDPGSADPGSVVPPTPIPGGEFGTRHFLPGRGKEVTTINDFNGVVGLAQLIGTGTGTANGATTRLNFSVDNRFLVGEYAGVDGAQHRASFGVF